MSAIAQHLNVTRHQIDALCVAAARGPGSVRLLAVSKTFNADAVREAAAAGQQAFGENYIQEAVDKITALCNLRVNGLPLEWHCIGPIQSNKTRLVAEHFDWVHTIDRLKIAQRLSEQRPSRLPPLNVCIQVNVAPTENKAGVSPPEALELAKTVANLPGLRLRGLMCIPDPVITDGELDLKVMQDLFSAVSALHHGFAHQLPTYSDWDTISMGMSADMAQAIAGGSTMVRIGSAIFGARTPKPSL